jgi:aspartokinase-like uncharacterized kinase
MIIAPPVRMEGEEQLYKQAVRRIERDLGLSQSMAHAVLADAAQAYGVFLDDIAQAVLKAKTLKRGIAAALRTAEFDRRPLELR